MNFRKIIIIGYFLPLTWNMVAIAEPSSEMVKIPGGSFKMGLEKLQNSLPKHEVHLSSFFIDRCEVTQDDYKKLMGKNPSATKERIEFTENLKNKSFKPTKPIAPVGDDYPITDVTWFEAVKYCNARSKKEGLEPCYDEKTGNVISPKMVFAYLQKPNGSTHAEPAQPHYFILVMIKQK